MDERKLRIYKFLFKLGRLTIDEIPEPYKSYIEQQDKNAN